MRQATHREIVSSERRCYNFRNLNFQCWFSIAMPYCRNSHIHTHTHERTQLECIFLCGSFGKIERSQYVTHHGVGVYLFTHATCHTLLRCQRCNRPASSLSSSAAAAVAASPSSFPSSANSISQGSNQYEWQRIISYQKHIFSVFSTRSPFYVPIN